MSPSSPASFFNKADDWRKTAHNFYSIPILTEEHVDDDNPTNENSFYSHCLLKLAF